MAEIGLPTNEGKNLGHVRRLFLAFAQGRKWNHRVVIAARCVAKSPYALLEIGRYVRCRKLQVPLDYHSKTSWLNIATNIGNQVFFFFFVSRWKNKKKERKNPSWPCPSHAQVPGPPPNQGESGQRTATTNRKTLIRSMRGRMFFGGGTVPAKAGSFDSNKGSNTKSHSYDYLFRRPEKGEDARIKGTALIVLNTPIDPTIEWLLGNIWSRADVIVCADGASNRLYRLSHMEGGKGVAEKYVPHVVCGDLDSIRPDVVDYYRDKGVEIFRVEDEGSNDLEKSLRIVKERYGVNRAILCGGLGGRFDHEMGNVNALTRNIDDFDQIVMLAGASFVCHSLFTAPFKKVARVSCRFWGLASIASMLTGSTFGPHCGLIPVVKPARVETMGLKWNLKGETLKMGGLVSTSNVLTADSVSIKTTAPLIWTTSLTVPPDGSGSSETAAGRAEALTVD
eukprot:jgi/Bigna1/129605/aug1.9_g4313